MASNARHRDRVALFEIGQVFPASGDNLLPNEARHLVIAITGVITLFMAATIAITATDIKRVLAYSTVSQLSYIILGVALLTPTAIEGGLIHITNHAFSKITLFFCAGAIYVASHKKNISEMGGLGRTMPFTFGAFAVASLSMIGVPGVAGFVSKWDLLVGSMEAHKIA